MSDAIKAFARDTRVQATLAATAGAALGAALGRASQTETKVMLALTGALMGATARMAEPLQTVRTKIESRWESLGDNAAFRYSASGVQKFIALTAPLTTLALASTLTSYAARRVHQLSAVQTGISRIAAPALGQVDMLRNMGAVMRYATNTFVGLAALGLAIDVTSRTYQAVKATASTCAQRVTSCFKRADKPVPSLAAAVKAAVQPVNAQRPFFGEAVIFVGDKGEPLTARIGYMGNKGGAELAGANDELNAAQARGGEVIVVMTNVDSTKLTSQPKAQDRLKEVINATFKEKGVVLARNAIQILGSDAVEDLDAVMIQLKEEE